MYYLGLGRSNSTVLHSPLLLHLDKSTSKTNRQGKLENPTVQLWMWATPMSIALPIYKNPNLSSALKFFKGPISLNSLIRPESLLWTEL